MNWRRLLLLTGFLAGPACASGQVAVPQMGVPILQGPFISAVNVQSMPAQSGCLNAKGDGVTDDTPALSCALQYWVSLITAGTGNGGAILLFSPSARCYKTTSTLLATVVNLPATGTKAISGYGAVLCPVLPTFASGYALEIKSSGPTAFIRNLTVEGLMIDGPGSVDSAAGMLLFDNDNATSFFTNLVIRDVAIEHFMRHGITIGKTGQACIDQSQIFGAHIQAVVGGTQDTIGFPLNVVNACALEIHGGVFVGGKNNVNLNGSTEIRLFGGKFLSAWNECISAAASNEVFLYGMNVENCWLGGVASPSWTTNQAAIFTGGTGRVYAFGGFLASNNASKVRYVYRVNGVGTTETVVIGCNDASGIVEYCVRNETGGKPQYIAINTGSAGAVVDAGGVGTVEAHGLRGQPDVSPSYPSADRGDASVTIQPLKDFEIQFFNTPLTANRAVTLNAGGTAPGYKFRIIRTAAATGTFSLTVQTVLGGNVILQSGQSADVVFDGTNWRAISGGAIAATPTLTLKKGSGAGNYTTASTSYVQVDASNLLNAVTIPTGWKLAITVAGAITTATAVATASVALTDAGTVLQEVQVNPTVIGTAGAESFALGWVVTGDGAAHSIDLRFKTSVGADAATLLNSTATLTPTMVFTLTPSN